MIIIIIIFIIISSIINTKYSGGSQDKPIINSINNELS